MKTRLIACVSAALFCFSACALPASAIYREPTTFVSWDGMQELDDKGMLQGSRENYGVYMNESGEVFIVEIRDKQYRFRLKADVDADDDAMYERIQEIVRSCYPDDAAFYVGSMIGCPDYYNVYDYTDQPEVNAEAAMGALLAEGLISEFYGIGQLAEVTGAGLPYWTAYSTTQYIDGERVPLDTEALQQYIDTAGLDCTLQYCTKEDGANGSFLLRDAYCVIPNTELTRLEHFELAVELYTALRISPDAAPVAVTLADNAKPYGQNALERPGDLNIDGASDVADAVLLSRVVAEDDTAPAVCDTGYLNADVDSDGLLTIMDVTALLDHIADIPAQS